MLDNTDCVLELLLDVAGVEELVTAETDDPGLELETA